MRLLFAFIGVIMVSFTGIPSAPSSNQQSKASQAELQVPAVIYGKVTLPQPVANPGRTSRGSAYRNRGNTVTEAGDNSIHNRFVNTIISVHPTSYEIENLPTVDTVRIVQQDAVFFPQVTPVTVGSTVQFINDDPFYHNVFSLTPGAKFNIGRRPTGDVYTKEVPPTKWKVSGIGPIDLFCDIHTQMNAVILSLDTPYFSRLHEDGSYELSGIPAGTYELRVYNKNYELYTQLITVADDQRYQVNITITN